MKYVVRIQAETKGGTLSNADGKLTVKGADEVVFYITADTDYKPNFDPDFKDPKTYVGVKPEETTKEWMNNAVSQGILLCLVSITMIMLLCSTGLN